MWRFPVLIFMACVVVLGGCRPAVAPSLKFPRAPLSRSDHQIWYDVNSNAKGDFALLRDESGKFNVLQYDDDEDGQVDRVYRLSDYDNAAVPHLIILLDSIPYQAVVDRYKAGDFNFFDPPVKVIPPFPSMSEQIFSQILHAPPLPGVVDDAYDQRRGSHNSGILQRAGGYRQPWEYRVNFSPTYWESIVSFLKPRECFYEELVKSKRALDESPDRVTVVYVPSSSGMLCKYAREGLEESLDAVQQLCLQVLYERHGAVKISMCADHGHNLTKSQNIHFEETLRQAGFSPTDHLRGPRDVVLDLDGLVTYLGVHTTKSEDVANVLLTRDEIELVTYMQQDRVIVRDPKSRAAISYRAGRFKYDPVEGDPLDYGPVVQDLSRNGKLDTDGFASDADWFAVTVDQQFPDAPRRLWDAFHGLVVNPPAVMLTVHDGYSAGDDRLRRFITMLSTHGGLNQVNSATFLLTMTDRATKPMRSHEIIPTVEPGYELPVRVSR